MKFQAEFDRFIETMQPLEGTSVVVGCSGGVDSMALLHAMVRSEQFSEVWACYVHHGLHEQSDVHAEFVEREAIRLGARFKGADANQDILRSGNGVEDGARRARYACLEACRLETGAAFIAVAHHRLDQLETFLIRLSQGSGIRGLSGMRSIRHQVIRPLLDVSKTEIQAYAQQYELGNVVDPTNEDGRFLRNSIRHSVLPVLDDVLGTHWQLHLKQLMSELKLRNDDDEGRASKLLESSTVQREKGVSFVRPILNDRSELEAKLFLRAVLERVLPSGAARRVQVNAVYDMALGSQSVTRRSLGSGVWAMVEYDSMFLGRIHDTHEEHCAVHAPGVYRWRDWLIGVETPIEGAIKVELPQPSEREPLVLRSQQSRDHFWGHAGHRKLSRLLIDRKVPRRLRKELLLVEFKRVNIWMWGFGLSRSPTARTEPTITLWIRPSRDFEIVT